MIVKLLPQPVRRLRKKIRKTIIAAIKGPRAPTPKRAKPSKPEASTPAEVPLPGPVKSDTDAYRAVLSRSGISGYHVWTEPNRADTPVLHIGESGERYSTITGVWWLDETRFIAAHRSGERVAIFDVKNHEQPLWTVETGHLTDDIAAKRLDATTWEFAVSGCWACAYARFTLTLDPGDDTGFALKRIEERAHDGKDFSHGVAYDAAGRLCVALHTGQDPRIHIGDVVWRLPAPWGARDVCFDATRKRYLAIAVSANPRTKSYTGLKTSLWELPERANNWGCVGVYPDIHSDALDVWDGSIWIPDQVSNALIEIDATSANVEAIYSGDCFDFPHGLGISPTGLLAVTNYGSSSVAIIAVADLKLQRAQPSLTDHPVVDQSGSSPSIR